VYLCAVNNSSSKDIFTIKNLHGFEQKALEVFQYQAVHNPIYKSFIELLGISPSNVVRVAEIPFLPISFFKQHAVKTSDKTEQVFSSSGTTGMQTSKHYVHKVGLYEESYSTAFNLFYGDISQYTLLALLPSYTEREGSSLIYMVDDLLQQAQAGSGYYLHNHQELFETLENLKKIGKPTILLGVTYALLDFIEQFPIQFPELIVMETGGMKGKRKELIREELHELLCRGFGVANIHSEYGMTELLSQAYSKGEGIFKCPPWMQVCIRDMNDPFQLIEAGKTGGINIIDLANVHSCSFIATQDLGKLTGPNQFEVLGRFDASDIRGCNLLVQ
jgi:phenylacetate-coenzyme A ligase PaaK-like adenylate-forming protein